MSHFIRASDGNGNSVYFSEEVLNVFAQYRQLDEASKEAGGQLFFKHRNDCFCIDKATKPSIKDKRGRYFFWPFRKKEQRDIARLFCNKMHYVGDWHTHPEPYPKPSAEDIHSIKSCFKSSDHQLKYFLMVIVGTAPIQESLYVALINSNSVHHLNVLSLVSELPQSLV